MEFLKDLGTIRTKSGKKTRFGLYKCPFCKKNKKMRTNDARRRVSKHCGCLPRGSYKTHGRAGTPEYNAWVGAKHRCKNKSYAFYERYGGRGIKVCDRWLNSFENFLEDMGERPSKKHSLDRIDNNGNYEPSNCRWATSIEQANNKKSNIIISWCDISISVSEWARALEVPNSRILKRLEYGWTTENTLFLPKGGKRD